MWQILTCFFFFWPWRLPFSCHPFQTHLPNWPRARVGRRRPRVGPGHRLSRIRRGDAHALIGGEFIRSCTIVSRGGELRKQGQEEHSRWTASTEGQEAAAAKEAQRGNKKREKRVNFSKEDKDWEEREWYADRKRLEFVAEKSMKWIEGTAIWKGNIGEKMAGKKIAGQGDGRSKVQL